MSYQPGIPTGDVDLDTDYLAIQQNFTALNDIFEVNHLPFSNNTLQQGYHTTVAMVPTQSGVNPPTIPSAISNYGQLFSATINDGINTDQALFWLSGGGRLTQLTSNFTFRYSTTQGTTSLPGGLILQWGLIAPSSTNQTISFNRAFPNNVYTIQVTKTSDSPSKTRSDGIWVQPPVYSSGPPAGYVSAKIINNDGTNFGYYWMAIGN